jgi:hypothetical protein
MDDLEQSKSRSVGGIEPVQLKPSGDGDAPIFGAKAERGADFPLAVWVVAAVVLVAVGAAVFHSVRKAPAAGPTTLQQADAYAGSLELTQFAMSEASNLSGGKLTYLDGHVRNTGGRTVSGITVQVVFQNDEAMPPQIDTLPLALIRMREPYIDIEPVSAQPLKPGDEREFRLTFETVAENWNTQMPVVRVVRVDGK